MSGGTTIKSDLDPAAEALADALLAAIVAGDTDGVARCCHEDVVVWHNNDDLEVTLDRMVRVLGWLHRKVEDLRYEEVRRQATAGGYVQQHVVRGVAPDGTALDLPACLLVQLRDGLISRIDEYLDSAGAAALMPTPAQG